MNNAAITVGATVRHDGDYANLARTGVIVGVFDTGYAAVQWSNGHTDMVPQALFGTPRCRVEAPKTKASLDAAIADYIARLTEQATRKGYGDSYTAEMGRRYVRIVHTDSSGSRFALAFIDGNGDIYKPHGWKGPAKGVRGNVYCLRVVAS